MVNTPPFLTQTLTFLVKKRVPKVILEVSFVSVEFFEPESVNFYR